MTTPTDVLTVEQAIKALVDSLCRSKGWTHAYANAIVRDAVDRKVPVMTRIDYWLEILFKRGG